MLFVLMLFGGAVLVLWRGTLEHADPVVDQSPVARWVTRMALLPLGLLTIFLLLVGMGDVVSGKLSGSGYLILAAPLISLLWLVRGQSCLGGRVLLSVGVVLSAYIYVIMPGAVGGKLEAVLVTGAPFLLSGGLLRTAVVVAQPGRVIRERSPWQAPPAPLPDAPRSVERRDRPVMHEAQG